MQGVLLLEQQGVHFPEFSLRSGSLGRFRRLLRMMMDSRERIVPEDDPQSGGDRILQVAKDRVQTPAIRALVISILNQRIGRILRTVRVVLGTKRKQETGRCGIHGAWHIY